MCSEMFGLLCIKLLVTSEYRTYFEMEKVFLGKHSGITGGPNYLAGITERPSAWEEANMFVFESFLTLIKYIFLWILSESYRDYPFLCFRHVCVSVCACVRMV